MKALSQGKYRSSLLLVLFCVFAFFSYQKNSFGAAAPWWFETHSLIPERFVLDGILRLQETGRPEIGTYLRKNNEADPRARYREQNREGPFLRYESQYGLQVAFFGAIAQWGFGQLEQLHAVSSLLMALVATGLVALVARDFSWRAAVGVGLLLALSPWMVIYARNLFWMPFAWFLPLAITLYFSPHIFTRRKPLWPMLALLYIALLVRFLCGYEFCTTVVVAAFCPLLYQALKQRIKLRTALRVYFLTGMAALLAFLTAFYLHIGVIADTRAEGWQKFVLHAEKRFYSRSPEETAQQICQGEAECTYYIVASLKASPLEVVRIYLVMPEFLPWLSTMRITEAERNAFKTGLLQQSGLKAKLQYTMAQPLPQQLYLLAKIANPLAFLAFVAAAFWVAMRRSKAEALVLAVSVTAALSWFVAAKGFCYIHDHLCFIAWYIPLLFYATITLCDARNAR